MNNDNHTIKDQLAQLETRVDELTAMCGRLRVENHSLVERLETITTERASLLNKNERVRGKVEAMVGRLKNLEHNV